MFSALQLLFKDSDVYNARIKNHVHYLSMASDKNGTKARGRKTTAALLSHSNPESQ